MNKEPVLIINAVLAVIAVAVGFGVNITTAQMGLISAALFAIASVVTRTQVTPTP